MFGISMGVLIIYVLACAPAHNRHIYIDKDFNFPAPIKTDFIPNSAEGKETTTKILSDGLQKKVSSAGFNAEIFKYGGRQSIKLTKDNVEVLVTHCSFDYLKDEYGLISVVWHPLGDGKHFAYHTQKKGDVYYKAEKNTVYQLYWDVPFYSPIFEIYRNKIHRDVLNMFKKDMTQHISFPIQLVPSFGKTKTEIKNNLEPLIGQKYVKGYYRDDIVFYVKVKNMGNEKIRMWPEKEAVVIDLETDSQYPAYSAESLKAVTSKFNKEWSNLYEKREEPFLGVLVGRERKNKNQLKILYVSPNSPAEQSGLKEGDIIDKIDDKKIEIGADFAVIFIDKLSGDTIKVIIDRNGTKINKSVVVGDRKNMRYRPPIKILSGGNIYPGVEYDGYLVFKGSAMSRNLRLGSQIKLIMPMIGVNFDASDTPINSLDLEFNFKLSFNS
jgi:PDZ domain